MDAKFSLITNLVAYADSGITTNPRLRYMDWSRQQLGLAVNNPETKSFKVNPGQSLTVFDGSVVITIGTSNPFNLSLNPTSSTTYRIVSPLAVAGTFGTLTAPGFTGQGATLTLNANQTLTVTAASGTPFTGAAVNDAVFMPGVATGDAATNVDPLNVGYWRILSVAPATVTLTRGSGVFSGVSQTITAINSNDLQIFNTPVKVGGSLSVNGGFAAGSRDVYRITAVTAKWIEFFSATPLALETGVTLSSSDLQVFSSSKRFVRIESDQECVVQINGDTSSFQKLTPWVPGEAPAEYTRTGPTWKLVLNNTSQSSMNVTVLSVE